MTSLQHAPAAVAPPSLREMALEDYQAVARLEASEGLSTTPEQDWRAFWLDNPVWPGVRGRWPFGWVLEDGGAVVGAVTNVPSRCAFQGRDLIAANGRGWVVTPAYRGFALWLLDEFFNQEHADIFFNTTVNGQAADAFDALGSPRAPVGEWESAAFRVTNPRGFATAALRIKNAPMAGLLGWPAGAALRLKDALTAPAVPPPPPGVACDWADGFDGAFDQFWDSLVASRPGTLLNGRSRAELAWHFAAPLREGHAWIATASRDGQMRAYAVFKRQDHEPSGLTRMRLVDAQSLEPDVDMLSGMVGAALDRCRAEGIGALEHVGCGLPGTLAFDRIAPYRRRLPAWPYYYKAAAPELEAALVGPGAWAPSAYDGDTSL